MGKRSLIASIAGIKVAKLKLEGRSLSQKAFAEELAISWSTINKFFNGKPVDRRIFTEICEALGLEWEDIVASPPLEVSQVNFDRWSQESGDDERGEPGDGEDTPLLPLRGSQNSQIRTQNPFQSLIADKTQGFVGREYVFNAISEFIAHQPNGYFIIQADPGVGKSAILAKYIEQNDCPAHFNVRAQGINRTAQFLESICTQLSQRYGLPYSSLPPEATTDGNFFAQLLAEVSTQLEAGEKLVIVIDALDEVDLASQDRGANILYLPAYLPQGVYFILSQRAVTLPLVVHTPQHLFDLRQYSQESLQDVHDYIRGATRRVKLRTWIEEKELTVEDFVTQLGRKSENNFMYLRYVLPQIEQGFYHNLSIDRLPKGLSGYYEDHWRRMDMNVKPLPRLKLKIVYILGEIRQPVSRRLIAEYAKDEQLVVQEVLDEWEQFLHEQEIDHQICYSIYHASFQDFLHRKDIVQAAGVDLRQINAMIADHLWAGLFEDV